jgi:hypothetical protein
MVWTNAAQTGAFKVDVATTNNGGHPPEFWADRCVDRLIHVSDDAPLAIREQALAYREQLRSIVLLHMRRAIQSDRTTISYAVTEAGHPQLAEMLRRL